jgi:hypothetical protein
VALDGAKNSIRALSNGIQRVKQNDVSIIWLSVIQAFATEVSLTRTIVGKKLTIHYKHFMSIAKKMRTKKNVKFMAIVKPW